RSRRALVPHPRRVLRRKRRGPPPGGREPAPGRPDRPAQAPPPADDRGGGRGRARAPARGTGPYPAHASRAGGAMSVLARFSLALVLALALGPGTAADEHRAGIETLRERIGDGPGAPADWRALGDALAATGEIEDALAAYRTALDGGVDEPFAVTVATADLSRLRD